MTAAVATSPGITWGRVTTEGRGHGFTEASTPLELRNALLGLPADSASWFSLCAFRDHHRANDSWQAAYGVVLDFDAPKIGKTKQPLPPETAATLRVLAGDGRLRGNLSYATPHGWRCIVSLTEPVTDADAFKAVAQGAAAMLTADLAEHGVTGIEVDDASYKRAQAFRAPCCRVPGERKARKAEVFLHRQETYNPDELAALAPVAETPANLPPVPLHALPGDLGRFVAAVADNRETSPEMALAAALSVASAAVPATARLRFRPGFDEISSLWIAVVAEPGSRKTPVLEALCAPLREHDRQLWAAHTVAESQHAARCAAMAKDKHRKHDPKPPAPARPQTVADDATAEALADVFNDNARFGLALLWAPDELTGLLGSLNQYKSGKGSDRQTLLKLWSGSPIRVNRRTRQVRVDAPRVSIIGAIQPTVARRLGAQDEADGLLERFHWVAAGDEGPPRANVPPVPDELGEAWGRTLRGLLPVIAADDLDNDAELAPPEADARTFTLDPEGWQTFAAWYETRDKRTIREPWFRGYAAKLPGQALRVILVLHHLKHGSETSRCLEISAATVTAGIELAEWLAMHTAVNRAAMAGDFTGSREARALLGFIRRRGGTVTLTEVMQFGPKDCRSAQAARDFGAELVRAEVAAWTTDTTTAGKKRDGLRLLEGGRNA